MQQNISDTVKYIGVDDRTLDLFENQYTIPEGICYNSYLILDEKVAVMDTVDDLKLDEWLANLDAALEGRTPDYVVVNHMEPDHAAGLQKLIELYPTMQVVGNAKTFGMISQFFCCDIEGRKVTVKEGDILDLGEHKLQFVTAPMVHWPEVMVAYDTFDKTLYSADAFGKFGAADSEEKWTCEARRYYYNIVGKYGNNVQSLLKKLDGVEVRTIAPLHGPIIREDIGYYVNMYDLWSRYQYEDEGVMIAYASIHGHTKVAAEKMAEVLKAAGCENVNLFDLARGDQSYMVEDAFQTQHLIVAGASYDAGLFPPMEHFLHHLKSKNYNGRKVGIIENGSWAPSAGKVMRAMLESMKNIDIFEETILIRSSYKESDRAAMERMAEWILNN
ncbi:MAG: FprA family A-type flavoprotein [Rikenellaceae bacterium]